MFFGWFKNRRRRKVLEQPPPSAWLAAISENVRHYARLKPAEQARVRDLVQIFLAEKNWEGCNGLKLTDEMKVVIAAEVGVLVAGFEPMYFDDVLSILVYPEGYVAPKQSVVRGGIVVEEDSARLGEAWYRGPVVLTWSEALASAHGTNRGQNVVLHEFAHQLDMLNGRNADGMPPMKSDRLPRWTQVLNAQYRRLVNDYEHGRGSVLDSYGTTNMAEFFAVTTETFFERPSALKHHLPDLYEVFRDFYRQDPAARETTN